MHGRAVAVTAVALAVAALCVVVQPARAEDSFTKDDVGFEFEAVASPSQLPHPVKVGVVVTGPYKLLLVGRSIVGAAFRNTGEPAFGLWNLIAGAVLGMSVTPTAAAAAADAATAPPPRRPSSVLQLGVGGGFVPRLLARYDPAMTVDAVELLPPVVTAARRHFGLPDAVNVVTTDAVELLQRPLGAVDAGLRRYRYDVVVHDLFFNLENPAGALSPTVLRLLHDEWLKPHTGVLVLSVVSPLPSGSPSTSPHVSGGGDGASAHVAADGSLAGRARSDDGQPARAVHAALSAVFANVQAHRDTPDDAAGTLCNVVFFASDGDVTMKLPKPLRKWRWSPKMSGEWLGSHFQEWPVQFPDDGGVGVDAAAAAAAHQDALADTMWDSIRSYLPAQVWEAMSDVGRATQG